MHQQEMTGIYLSSGRGFGFFRPEQGEDYFVPPRREGGAWDGDTVVFLPDPCPPEDGERRTGTVKAVVSRNSRTVTGTLYKQGRQMWLQPDRDKLPGPIRVAGKRGQMAGGDKAAVHITSFGGRGEPPMGRLEETFGKAGDRAAAVEAMLYQYGICREFPPEVEQQAALAPTQVEQAALVGRRDLRGELIFTIDGDEAKDLDDAVSLVPDGAGRWVLGVHIADVSHYVPQGSPLDREAWERGTSVYFADQVVPMLPVQLSNGICSLNPGVDRLTLSCFMTVTDDGEVVGHEIVKSVIRTAWRMTYAHCNTLLEGGDRGLEEKYACLVPTLRHMAQLAGVLKRRRRLRGSLELESSEAAILCNETGKPVNIVLRRQGRAESLIEEFMLAANETVARHLHELGKPAVYRVHEKPSEDKTERLRAMLAPFGLEVRQADHFALQKILEQVKGKPEEPIINAILLRALMKARYDPENLGHFGLAAGYYCHFTSPIRRYPDLMVHRILTALLEGTLRGAQEKKLAGEAARAAVQASEREIAAQQAEREIEKLYMAEFMQKHVGEQFSAAVSGVTRFGLFVMLPCGVEGMVPLHALPDESYDYDEGRMTLTGRSTVFSFGMALEVVCTAADPGSGRVDFALPGTGGSKAPAPRSDIRETEKVHRRKGGGRRAMRVPKGRKGRKK